MMFFSNTTLSKPIRFLEPTGVRKGSSEPFGDLPNNEQKSAKALDLKQVPTATGVRDVLWKTSLTLETSIPSNLFHLMMGRKQLKTP